MAKKHIDVEQIVEDWVSVSADDDPLAFKAWMNWRRESLKCYAVPKAFTVPSVFPPTTQTAVNDYLAALSQIRTSIGWKSPRAKFPENVRPYHG